MFLVKRVYVLLPVDLFSSLGQVWEHFFIIFVIKIKKIGFESVEDIINGHRWQLLRGKDAACRNLQVKIE